MFSKQLERSKRPSNDLDHESYKRNPLKQFPQLNDQPHKLCLTKNRAEIAETKMLHCDFTELSRNSLEEHRGAFIRYKFEPFLQALQHKKENDPLRITADLKRKLEDFVAIVWKELYPQVYDLLQNAVREHQQQTMVAPRHSTKFNFKSAKQTENYNKFLAIKRKIAKQLLITKEPVRTVLDFAARELPETVFNLKDGLGERQAVPHSWLTRFLNKEIAEMNYFLRWVWYPKLIEILKHQIRYLKHLEPRLLQCIEGLIRREIIKIKIVWLSKMLSELSSMQMTPVLQFSLEIEAYEIQLKPSISTIIEMYASLARKVANIGVKKLSAVKFAINVDREDVDSERFINLELDENYLAEYIVNLKEAIKQSFRPVQEFFDNFKASYNGILQSVDFDHYDFLAASHPFSHYVAKMTNYSSQKNALQLLPQLKHFVMATVQTTPAVSQLVSAAQNFIKLVADDMTAQHIDYLKTICNDYEQIKSYITKEPECIEDLIEITNYVNSIKDQYLLQLEERVKWARHVRSKLQRVTEFSQYHWNLYIITLNWVNYIKVVCEENSAQLEHFSELFKQYLKVRIHKLNDAIDDLCSKVGLLNNVEDLSELEGSGEYAIFYRNVLTRLEEFSDCIKWINEEERFFNLPETAYLKLEEAKIFVSKFCTKKD